MTTNTTNTSLKPKLRKGFAVMDKDMHLEISLRGGIARAQTNKPLVVTEEELKEKKAKKALWARQKRAEIKADPVRYAQHVKQRVEWQKKKYQEVLAIFHAYKVEKGCMDCGYNASPYALDFDHRDPSTKVAGVAHLIDRMVLERIWAEIAKCDVVCSNCHRIRTHDRRHP